MAHNDNIKTSKAISKHLEMEDERQKSLVPLSVAFVAKGSKPKGKRPFCVKQAKKGPRAPENSRPGKGIAKKQKAQGNGEKKIACVKCYNCGKKGYYARDYPEPSKVPFPARTPDINVCSHVFVANSLPQWIVDMGATKHIVQEKTGFVKFQRYPVDSQTVILVNGSEGDVLGVGAYQLKLRGRNKLLLHYSLYAPKA